MSTCVCAEMLECILSKLTPKHLHDFAASKSHKETLRLMGQQEELLHKALRQKLCKFERLHPHKILEFAKALVLPPYVSATKKSDRVVEGMGIKNDIISAPMNGMLSTFLLNPASLSKHNIDRHV